MTNEDELLFREYESARQLTYHIDEQRARLTSYFLTFSGAGFAGLVLLLKGEVAFAFLSTPERLVGGLLGLIGLIGVICIAILARLRRVQLEHFRIMNNIRSYYINQNWQLWNVVELSRRTLPRPRLTSGTYFWMLIISIVSSLLCACGIVLLVADLSAPAASRELLIVITLLFLCVMTMTQSLYFKFATLPEFQVYTESPDVRAQHRPEQPSALASEGKGASGSAKPPPAPEDNSTCLKKLPGGPRT